MILIDANLLIYAVSQQVPQHRPARVWLDRQLNTVRVGLPWFSLLAFVRLVGNPRIFETPRSVTEAWQQVEAWLSLPGTWIPTPTNLHQETLGRLIPILRDQPRLVPDAHLAALAIEHDLTLCSADKDFERFPGLRWENPL